jgi:signal transduction histidine kinase
MILAVVVTILVALVISGAAYVGMRMMVVAQEDVARAAQAQVTETERLRAAFDREVAYELGYLLTGEARLLERAAESRSNFLASHRRLADAAQTELGARLVAEVGRAEAAYARMSDALNDWRAERPEAEYVADVFEEEVGPTQDEVAAAIARLADHKTTLNEAARDGARTASVNAMRLVGGIAALALLATVGMGWVQIRASRREQQAMQAWKEYLSIASHDLKSPLAAMRFQLALLRRQHEAGELEPGALETALERLDRQSRIMADLTSQNLDVTRLDVGARAMLRREADLVEIVRGVAERFRDECARAKSELSVEAPAAVPGRWDPVRLDQVIANLLSNAVKYGGGKPVMVVVVADDRTATVRVVDHGGGIAPGDQRRIFERFTRLSGQAQAGSHGLGLWIARRIVEAHGGRLAVHSSPGAGATFVVELPRWPDGKPGGGAAAPSPGQASPALAAS